VTHESKLVAPEPMLAAPQLLGGTRKAPLAAGMIAVALLGAGYFALGSAAPAAKGDRISEAEAAKLADAFRHGRGALLPVDLSSERRRDELVQLLRLPRQKADSLMAMVERGERTLGWLTLWDNFDEDGDIASVSAGGFTQTVPLMHAPTRVLVAYIPGQPVFITGERDGMGGGVTLAVELSTGPLPLPPLAVGHTVALPLQ
jgi:hypothetical protein